MAKELSSPCYLTPTSGFSKKLCRVGSKEAESRPRVKYWKTALSIFALSASLALAEDFKTVNGKEYKNAQVSRVEPDGIILKTKSGIAKVYFAELPKEVQERFNYNPASAAQFRATVQAAAAQFTTATPQQQTQVAADNLHTIREAETDQPSFLDQPFILKSECQRVGKPLSRLNLYGVGRGAGVGRGRGVGVHLPVHGVGVGVGAL